MSWSRDRENNVHSVWLLRESNQEDKLNDELRRLLFWTGNTLWFPRGSARRHDLVGGTPVMNFTGEPHLGNVDLPFVSWTDQWEATVMIGLFRLLLALFNCSDTCSSPFHIYTDSCLEEMFITYCLTRLVFCCSYFMEWIFNTWSFGLILPYHFSCLTFLDELQIRR